jgi:RNA polymerase sigma-70 factor (ECF subfamily)
VLYSDGGGKRRAALNPLFGADRITRFYRGIHAKGSLTGIRPQRAAINGLPGFLMHTPQGTETIAFETSGGKISAIFVVRNPDKLRHLS